MENQPKRAVVIDDDSETRTLYAEILREAGFDVREGVDGLDGLEKVNQGVPDVILSGIIMPRMDGFSLVEALKKNVATMNVPVMFLSHLGRQEDETRARAMGVSDFFVTSMTPPYEILSRIKGLLSSSEYLIIPNPYELDAQKLAQDLNLNRDFLCSEGGEKLAIKLHLKDAKEKRFEAQIVCI